jgi:hypothetical protein
MTIEAMKQALEALNYLQGLVDTERGPKAAAALRQAIAEAEKQEPIKIDGNTSDGYHTFNELYEFRKAYNVALFNEWAAGGKCSVHKSWRHHDGELCFGGGWFIVVAVLPNGQISNHYEAKDWDLFAIPETERALFEFDGHTGSDVIARLKTYTTPQPQQAEKQEPVAYPDGDVVGPCICGSWPGGKCLKCPRITPQPQREWVGLTDAEKMNIAVACGCMSADWIDFAKAIEQALKEKNT